MFSAADPSSSEEQLPGAMRHPGTRSRSLLLGERGETGRLGRNPCKYRENVQTLHGKDPAHESNPRLFPLSLFKSECLITVLRNPGRCQRSESSGPGLFFPSVESRAGPFCCRTWLGVSHAHRGAQGKTLIAAGGVHSFRLTSSGSLAA